MTSLKDVGDLWMLVTSCWLQFFGVGARRLCYKIKDVDDENDQNRHQHLKIVANTFRLQHPSPTSVTNINVAQYILKLGKSA